MSKKFHILFVCSGNSCRSPMAEGLLKKKLFPEYLNKIEIQSAGTLGIIDSPATPLTIKVAAEKGVDITNHLSQALTEDLLKKSDLVLTMEEHHKEFIRNNFPDYIDKVHLLTEYGMMDINNEQDFPPIPDPIGENLNFYRKVINQIDREITRILPMVKEQAEKNTTKRASNE